MKAYKGFDKDWKCRDFQYELGKEFVHEGPVRLCSSGFHFCEAPLDCLSYYNIIDGNFAEIEAEGVTDERENDTKRVGSKISIKTKLSIAGLVNAQVEWVKENVKDAKEFASGYSSTAASSGSYSMAASSGYSSTAASSGYSSTAASSGPSSTAASSGEYSMAASSGYSSTAASSGYSSTAASSGYSSTAASSGKGSTAASSGSYSMAASSGDGSTAASSGKGSTAASSGYSSTAASSGNGSMATAKGSNTIACVAGLRGQARAGENGCFTLHWHDGKRNRSVTGYIGENGVEANVLYEVSDAGKLGKA